MTQTDSLNFSAPLETAAFAALLFDMDGTIIDSTAAIEKYWLMLGKEIGVPGETILKTSHGRRTVDTLAIFCPEKANWDFACAEEAKVPKLYGQDAVEIPGSRLLLEKLEAAGAPWAIVTSGTRGLVTGWIQVMKLAHPKYLVTAEEVEKGKPDPACYRLGARRLGFDDESSSANVHGSNGTTQNGTLKKVDPSQILVLEDAPAGVKAGKAAGYKVVALATTHTVEQLREAGADWIVRDMRSVNFTGFNPNPGEVKVEIKDALVW
jgi:glycerol-1-phosphatase